MYKLYFISAYVYIQYNIVIKSVRWLFDIRLIMEVYHVYDRTVIPCWFADGYQGFGETTWLQPESRYSVSKTRVLI
jgi:hypothetical protein